MRPWDRRAAEAGMLWCAARAWRDRAPVVARTRRRSDAFNNPLTSSSGIGLVSVPHPFAPANGRGTGTGRPPGGQQSGRGAGIARAYESVSCGWHGRIRKKSSQRDGTAINRLLAVAPRP
ncbi:hypothetical protein KH5H1_43800 [Corallococcus caeni]|nr:hypothetical protein KH5H1_43800 [Corallococcus sp. KH5-1]